MKPVPRPSLSSYFAAMRQRTDTWQDVKTQCADWVDAKSGSKTLEHEIEENLEKLSMLESYFAYPGVKLVYRLQSLFNNGDRAGCSKLASFVVRMLVSHAYRIYLDEDTASRWPESLEGNDEPETQPGLLWDDRPYFEVLVVDDLPEQEVAALIATMREFRSSTDEFVYDLVVVPSFEDALIATLLNHHIQSVVIRYGFPVESRNRLTVIDRTMSLYDISRKEDTEIGLQLGRAIHNLRPNLDLYLVTDAPVETLAGKTHQLFKRVFYRQEDYRELHQSILKGIGARYATPFFTALRNFTQRPTGVFHALPIARGKSVTKSHWIREMEDFFGPSLFLAETSATTAGLDSLLQPQGSLRTAQQSAARAFGAERTYFVTNGTSTANKIVLQAVSVPGDIVLATRDCHQSHHYGMVLTGAQPLYMNPFPVSDYSFYGGVPLSEIKRQLIHLREIGKLDRARVLLLTNCTFDGIVYNPEKVMMEVLAIQPEMTFIWDEAWFAFAYFTPITRSRTAMAAAKAVRKRLASEEYRQKYLAWKSAFDADPDPNKWLGNLMPDPDVARVRVYATQSTHKTLTSLRQGSMIHISDDDFARRMSESFHQAYLTHTSTSANYPILASLDLGRRQVELEGYELVQHAIELSLTTRERVNGNPALSQYFQMLSAQDMIPAEYRASGFANYREARTNWKLMDKAWQSDEFCLDPTRMTLSIGKAGIEGDQLKKKLIERYDIQVNKTTRNSLLFMTHIGTTRGAVAHLIEVLADLAQDLSSEEKSESSHRSALRRQKVQHLTHSDLPLPDFSEFHPKFKDVHGPDCPTGDIRTAYFLACDDQNIRFITLGSELEEAVRAKQILVSAGFVTPYPPGFPVLVPGQVISPSIIDYLRAVDVGEIHGYDHELGIRIFNQSVLE